jgi:16S rRNA (cytosine1402-N4)-methyltransferase
MGALHVPVLLGEVVGNLVRDDHRVFVDATIGGGGHARAIVERYPQISLIGIDADEEALAIAQEMLEPYQERVRLIRGNFRDLDLLLREAGFDRFDGILFDLGLSSYQLGSGRAFSFHDEGRLDMRMDVRSAVTAYHVVNTYSYERLKAVLLEYGEEYRAHRIARAIVEVRKKKPIVTGKDLSGLVASVKGRSGRINPATKTFQAIRMEVNRELESLASGLDQALAMLSDGGSIGVISFHSLEDRMVKNLFRQSPVLEVLTKKPIRAGVDEKARNPSARSAKLRIARKL